MSRKDGISRMYQPTVSVFEAGGKLLEALQEFVKDDNISDENKKNARKLIENPPKEEIAIQEERFRFQTWLDGERASMFFADRVLLVEGATEKALFNYLLANDWHDLTAHRVYVVDVLGKYNFHRYMALLEAYGIPHGLIMDNDNDKDEHKAINEMVRGSKNDFTLADPVEFEGCLGRRPINQNVIQDMKQGGFHVWDILVNGRTIQQNQATIAEQAARRGTIR